MPAPPLQAWIRALESVALMQRDPAMTLPTLLERLCVEHAERPAFLGDRPSSYAQLAQRMHQVATWAAPHRGATIGLLLPNRPDYVALWLGLTRAGCIVALLNPNLVGPALAHAVQTAACRLVIATPTLAGHLAGVEILDPDQLDAPVRHLPPPPAQSDVALLVFTSGTTGLPKAARITHGRVLDWALWFAGMMDVAPDDRLYDCLPLYHSTGGIVAIGACLVRGASILVADGFSASRFWDDVVEHRCTLFFYIGELCRYLTATPPNPNERAHRLRLAVGNGLQVTVWRSFQERFAIPAILEFYAATEGSVSLYNCEGRPGAIGRVPPFLQSRFPLALIRLDPDSRLPLRDDAGLCIPCAPDQPGEALGRLDQTSRFDAYTDPAASAQKLLHDVLAPGDRWFRTGDLMRRDVAGYVYFVDRLGDTFRWKGENVSTTEVAAHLRAASGVIDAIVYGVAIPGQEGRAGMAAIIPTDDFDPVSLHRHVSGGLPRYARPVFLRLCRTLDLTHTLKLATTRYAREGFTPGADPILIDVRTGYVPLTAALAVALENGAFDTLR